MPIEGLSTKQLVRGTSLKTCVKNTRRNLRSAITGLVCLILFSAAMLKAQVNTGSLSGLVVDASGAAVADTDLTVTSTDTGYVRTGKSQSDGAYTLADCPSANTT